MNRRWLYLLLVAVSIIVYLPSLSGKFVWDDVHLITMEIQNLHGLSLFKAGGIYYRPLVGITFLIDFLIWKWNPMGYHLTNIILHTFCVLLVFQVTRMLLVYHSERQKSDLLAFFTALFFAIHPVHTESVAWVAGRTDVLATLFFLLAFLAYLISRLEKVWVGLFLSFLFFLFSLGSKFIGIAFPGVVLVYELMLNRTKKGVLLSFLYVVPFVPYLLFRANAFSLTKKIVLFSLKGMTVVHFVQLFFSSVWFYLVKSFWPFPQNAFIGEVPSFYHPFAGLIVLLLLILAVVRLNEKRLTSFWLAFFFVTLLPSLVPVYVKVVSTPLAERYLYLPSIAICFMVPCVFLSLVGKREAGAWDQRYKGAVTLLVLIVIAGGIASAKRSLVWKNELTLWADTVKKSSKFGKVHGNYGVALMNVGRLDEAEREFRLALSPRTVNTITGRSNACVNLGIIHVKRGEYKKAERAYRAALKYWKGNVLAYYNLGYLYLLEAARLSSENERSRYLSLSRDVLRKTLQMNSSFIKARLLLGKVYYYLGDRLSSMREFEALIKEAPERKEAREAKVWIRKIYRGL